MNAPPKRCLFCGQENEAHLAKCQLCHKPLHEAGIIDRMEAAMIGVLQRELEDRYEIAEKIGHSGTSLIFKARQKGVQRPVALKVPRWLFPLENRLPKALAQRFHQEARQLSQLEHHGIVRLLDWDIVEEQLPYLALQYLEGKDLRQVLQKSALPLEIDTVRRWFIALAEALGYAHQKGVVHCDLKSANIIISPEGEPTLIDFSIARDKDIRKLAEITQQAGVPGTWLYMSPEQALRKTVDARSDIYSFGVVLYETLTGKLPFEGNFWNDIHDQTLYSPPTSPRQHRPNIPETLENVVLRCLMKAPEERYQNCAELISALKNGEPKAPRFKTIAPLPTPSTHWRDPRARQTKIFAVVLLLIVSGLLLWLFGHLKEAAKPVGEVSEPAPMKDSSAASLPVSSPTVLPPPSPNAHPEEQQKRWLEEAIQKFGTRNFEAAWQLCAQILRLAPNNAGAMSLQQQIRAQWSESANALIAKGKYNDALEVSELIKKYDSAQEAAKIAGAVYEHQGDQLHARRAYAAAHKKYHQGWQAAPSNSALMKKENDVIEEIKTWLDITLVFIPGDTFRMGDVFGESKALGKEHDDERPAHLVRVENFYMSAHEITFAQYAAFCAATGHALPSDNGWGQGNRPIINVSWEEANAFCAWLAQNVGKNTRISLPSEAEWEFAAREGGKARRYSGTNAADSLSEYAWFNIAATRPVGRKHANAIGLFDISGNVYEWCWDRYDDDYYKKSPTENPRGPNAGKDYVVRGGSIFSTAAELRTTDRARTRSSYKLDKWKHPTGFRIVVKD